MFDCPQHQSNIDAETWYMDPQTWPSCKEKANFHSQLNLNQQQEKLEKTCFVVKSKIKDSAYKGC